MSHRNGQIKGGISLNPNFITKLELNKILNEMKQEINTGFTSASENIGSIFLQQVAIYRILVSKGIITLEEVNEEMKKVLAESRGETKTENSSSTSELNVSSQDIDEDLEEDEANEKSEDS